MKKSNLRVKDCLSEVDKMTMINFMVDGYFTELPDGEVLYTPYLKKINERTAFFLYAVEGLTFEVKKDENGQVITDETGAPVMESVYECSLSDEELVKVYKTVFSNGNPTFYKLKTQFQEIEEYVKDIVEFRKQKLIHTSTDSLGQLLTAVTEKVKALDAESLKVLREISGQGSGDAG